jgi:hypothetical protein
MEPIVKRSTVEAVETGSSSPESARAARRRLLRGSFGVPTVLALSSGSALANTSAMRCYVNGPTYVPNPVPANYFRVPLYRANVQSTETFLVLGADIRAFNSTRLDAATYANRGERIRVSDGTAIQQSSNPQRVDGAFVVLRLDYVTPPGGVSFWQVTGLALDQTIANGPGRVMTASCWTSFA